MLMTSNWSISFLFMIFNPIRMIVPMITKIDVILIKVMLTILKCSKRKRFCGLPIGVRLLPMLAARVSKIMMYMGLKPALLATRIVRGTTVINATSFVTNMARMAVVNIIANPILLGV